MAQGWNVLRMSAIVVTTRSPCCSFEVFRVLNPCSAIRKPIVIRRHCNNFVLRRPSPHNFHLVTSRSRSGVDAALAVSDHFSNHSSFLQVVECFSC